MFLTTFLMICASFFAICIVASVINLIACASDEGLFDVGLSIAILIIFVLLTGIFVVASNKAIELETQVYGEDFENHLQVEKR